MKNITLELSEEFYNQLKEDYEECKNNGSLIVPNTSFEQFLIGDLIQAYITRHK